MEIVYPVLGVLGAALATRFSVWVLAPITLVAVLIVAWLSPTLVQGIIASVIAASALQIGYLLGTVVFAGFSISAGNDAPDCVKAQKNGN